MQKACTHCKTETESGEHSAQWDLIKWQGQQQSKKDTWQHITIITLVAIITILCILGGFLINKLNSDYKQSVENITQKYLDYLSEYDFSGTTEVVVDGQDGTALYQDGEGNVLNNGEDNKESNEEAN